MPQFINQSSFLKNYLWNLNNLLLIALKSIILNLRNNVESQLWIEIDQNYQENANFRIHFHLILASFSSVKEEMLTKINLHEFIYIMNDSSLKKLVQASHFSDEFLFNFSWNKEVEQLEEDLNQDLNIFDNFTQDWTDFKNNDEWKIKQGLVFTIIQISSNYFTNLLASFCQKH